MSGLFGTFNIAKRGLFAQQKSIDVTSHNISNANTEGYSRQRAELQTTRPEPMPSANNAVGPGQLGTGVEVAAVNRVRDSFLDYQIRVETGVDGHYKGRDQFLSQVENILNEPTDTGISTLVGKLFSSWSILSGTQADKSNSKSVVAQQSLALTNELNHTYSELQDLKENSQSVIKDTVFNVNSMLSQVSQLNQEIKQVKVAGNAPNDLMDRRDLLLDQLSANFGINVDKQQFEGIDVTTSNESKYKDTTDDGSAPVDANGKALNLVQILNPDNVATFSYVSKIVKDGANEEGFNGSGTYNVSYYQKGDINKPQTIKINIANAADYKQLDESRVLWADKNGMALNVTKDTSTTPAKATVQGGTPTDFANLKLFMPPTGELKGYMSVQQDIDKYEDQLNKLAKALAFSINSVYSQSSETKADGGYDSTTNKDGGLNFFVNSSGDYSTNDNATAAENGITAGNITINKSILKDPSSIITGKDKNSGESDGTRALLISQIGDRLLDIPDISSTSTRKQFLSSDTANPTGDLLSTDSSKGILNIVNKVGNMTLGSYFKDTVDSLGIQEQEAKRMVTNQAKLLAGFEESRASVSGVSLDEEMANLIQFQHCYQANAKVISTVDELLDVIVNQLKR